MHASANATTEPNLKHNIWLDRYVRRSWTFVNNYELYRSIYGFQSCVIVFFFSPRIRASDIGVGITSWSVFPCDNFRSASPHFCLSRYWESTAALKRRVRLCRSQHPTKPSGTIQWPRMDGTGLAAFVPDWTHPVCRVRR